MGRTWPRRELSLTFLLPRPQRSAQRPILKLAPALASLRPLSRQTMHARCSPAAAAGSSRSSSGRSCSTSVAAVAAASTTSAPDSSSRAKLVSLSASASPRSLLAGSSVTSSTLRASRNARNLGRTVAMAEQQPSSSAAPAATSSSPPPSSPPPRPPFALPLDAEVVVARGSKTLLCTSVTADTLEKALEEVKEAAATGATCIELRLDCLRDLDPAAPDAHLRALLKAVQVDARLPAIVTFRPKWEGGKYEGEEAPRLAALKWATLLGSRFVDVEVLASPYFFAASTKIPVPLTTSIILSHHDYEKTPDFETLSKMVQGMFEAGADVAKIATTATRDGDAAVVLSLAATTAELGPCIALAMGEKGLPSRILAPKYGSFLTFGALGKGRASAPGQPSLRGLVSTYRLGKQSARTRVFGVLGNPVSHSRSPALHNAAIEAVGNSLDAVYLPFLVDDLPTFLRAFDEEDFGGFSVTIPHKLAALEAAASADPLAASIGAANTLVRDPKNEGKLRAYNTDAPAAIGAIEEGLRKRRRSREREGGASGGEGSSSPTSSSEEEESPLRGKTVVVLGAGGAGRALAFGAAAAGAATVVVANRDESKAKALCADLKSSFEGIRSEGVSLAALVAKMPTLKKVDVVANSTSVGMAKKGQRDSTESPLGDDDAAVSQFLSGCDVVFDAVYTPLKTKLLADAERAGCGLVSGLEMFVGQAALQFELFFPGVRAPVEVMREAVLESVRREEEEEGE